MSRKRAIKAAKYHRDHATSDGIRRYWQLVIDGIKSRKSSPATESGRNKKKRDNKS